VPAPPILTAAITYPIDGATNADLTLPVRWTNVANVQAYYLYIGSSVGAKDLVNTGEIDSTSYLTADVPLGQLLYARMWTKVGGIWRYVDSTFTAVQPVTAKLTFPVDGATSVSPSHPIQWTSVVDVQAYYLYVGTTVGAKDLIDTGEIQQTTYVAAGLPAGQTLYARLWTKVGGVWRFVDSTYSVATTVVSISTITYPPNGALDADPSIPIQWTAVTQADAYYLYLGTTPGAKDLIDSGETNSRYYPASGLPIGATLYARLWTKVGGIWRYSDSTFQYP